MLRKKVQYAKEQYYAQKRKSDRTKQNLHKYPKKHYLCSKQDIHGCQFGDGSGLLGDRRTDLYCCGENERAEYGKGLLNFLSDKLTAEFGKGFTVSNLRNMRQFYLAFPKRYTVCSNLSWSHYRVLMRISDSKRRTWYTDECAESSASLQSYPRL